MTTSRVTWRHAVLMMVTGVAVVALLFGARGGYRASFGWRSSSVYDGVTWLHVAALFVLTTLLGAGLARWQRIAGFVLVIASARLAGTGVVAVRRWDTSGGFSQPALNEVTLQLLAAALAAAACAGFVAAVGLTRQALVGAEVPSTAGIGLLAGVAVAVGVPMALGVDPRSGSLTAIGAHVVLYGLPWALGVLGVIAAPRRRAAAVTAGYLLIDVVCVARDDQPIIPFDQATRGTVFAAVLVCAALLHRLGDRTPAGVVVTTR